MMHNKLLQAMNLNFFWKKSRLECFAQIIISIIENCSVIGKDMALGINNKSKYKSKIQRIYRFFKDQQFNYAQVAEFILSIFACDQHILVLDRTCWKYGKKDINILFLAIVIGNISVPIYWRMLNHSGTCDHLLMKEILDSFIDNFGVGKIKYLLADREFMNHEWLAFLNERGIKFAIPLRKDMKVRFDQSVQTNAIGKSFNNLKQCEYDTKKAILWNYPVQLAAYRNSKDELMVVASSADIDVSIFALYKYRWAIERLFKHLKTSGFDIEKTHMTRPDRFAKLIAACAIASALAIKNGLIKNQLIPIKFRKYKDTKKQLVSFFTYGLDHLKYSIKQGFRQFASSMKKILKFDKKLNFNLYFSSLLQKL